MSDIIEQAKKHYQIAKNGWDEIYRKAKQDLEFLSDSQYAQWDAREAAARASVNRPILEVDQLSQFIHQVVNDIRMNTPSIKIIPDDDKSDLETAEILSGRIRAIEYKSQADSAYDMAADFAVRCSIGFLRVDHDYTDDDGFEQELKICRVVNPTAVLIDPCSIEPDGSDAKYGFVFEEMSLDEFKSQYPNATPLSFGEEDKSKKPSDSDKITIAEYFVIQDEMEERGLLDDGTSEPVSEGKKYKRTRKIKKPKVMRYKLAFEDELESTTFPGKYIPIVPVYGEELWIDGKRNLNSLIRKSKSSQVAYNMLKSSETEILLKQQQSPVQAAVGQMRGFEEDWKTPEKAMVLYYHTTDVNGIQVPPPQRLAPPVVSQGFAQASMDAENNIRKTLGMYNAGVGKREGQSSGVALKQLEMSGDVASFHFGDNLVKSIAQVGRILVAALPVIEDTPRVVNIIDEEENIKQVGINGAVARDQKQTYDINKGKWGVRVTTGASFTTQRQEAAAYYAEVIKSIPDLMPAIGDLVFKYQDAPGAQAISARLKKLVDPKLLDESEREDGQDPQVMQLTAQLQELAAQAQQQISQLQAELENKQAETMIKMGELKIKQEEVAIKNKEADIKAADVKLKFITATQTQEPQPTPIEANDSIEVLNAKLAEKLTKQQMEAEQAALAQQQEMLRQQQEQEMELREQALKAAELEQRQAQASAMIQALSNISGQLNQLTQSVSQPITVIRDEAGNMIGAQ